MSDEPREIQGEDLAGRFTLGPTSPAYWAEVIDVQRRRLQRGVDAHQARRLHPDRRDQYDGFRDAFLHDLGPMVADAHFLLIAVRHLIVMSQRMAAISGDRAIDEELERFLQKAPDARKVRNVLEHLDAYAVHEGWKDDTGAQGQWWPMLGMDTGLPLRVGNLTVHLGPTAELASEFGYWVARRWRSYVPINFEPYP